MNRFVFLAKFTLLILLLAGSVDAAITIEGETVHVETDAYTVQFDKGVITHIHNKLTDETYTIGEGVRGWSGISYSSGEPTSISTRSATLVSAALIDPFHAELLFRREDVKIWLFVSIDGATDDMLINVESESARPGVVGIQWGCSFLDVHNLSLIAPTEGGRIIDATTPRNFRHHSYPSSSWEAQLAIVQGEHGGFYVRNTDNTFRFKQFTFKRIDDGFALNFGTHNQAPFDTHTRAKSDLWRFNTYAGDWRVPARIYRDWMEQAFNARRLSDMPAGVEDLSLFLGSAKDGINSTNIQLLDRLAELVDPTRTVVMLTGWADGGEWWSKGQGAHHPDYIPQPEFGHFVETAHQHGFRVVPWIIAHAFSPTHPLYPEFQKYQYRDTWTGELLGECWDAPLEPPCDHPAHDVVAYVSAASSEYRNLIAQTLKSVWEEYGVDGFFLDANHFVINDGNGLIDGLNMAQGMDLLHRELAEAMPGIILGGERLHEATFARLSFAQRPRLTDKIQAHPISSFLFSPFTHAIGYAAKNPDVDPDHHRIDLQYHEIWGVVPTLNVWAVEQLGEDRVETQKVLAIARTWEHRYGLNGDVNNDGTVNIMDLTLVSQNIGVTPLTDLQADVNGDGKVNVLDLILVSNMFEGTTIAQ